MDNDTPNLESLLSVLRHGEIHLSEDAPASIIAHDKDFSPPLTSLKRKVKKEHRAGLSKASLAQLLPTLPPPDTDLWLITSGDGGTVKDSQQTAFQFEFGHFIPQLADLLGNHDISLYLTTWAMNREHALGILDLLEKGYATRVLIGIDFYLKNRQPSIYATLAQGLAKHGQTIVCFRNHTKILAMSNGIQYVTIFSSANLSSQPRNENYCLTTSPETYHWVVNDFFNQLIPNR